MSNIHCGRHDKIFPEEGNCPGCATEAATKQTEAATAQPGQNLLNMREKHAIFLAHFEDKIRTRLERFRRVS